MSLLFQKRMKQSLSIFLCLLLLCSCNVSKDQLNNDASVPPHNDASVPPYIDISDYSFSSNLENSIVAIHTDHIIYTHYDDIPWEIDTSQCLPVFNVNLVLDEYITLQNESE